MIHASAVPSRTDLRTRRERVTARAMLRAVDFYDRLKDRVLVDVAPPGADPFYRLAENLEAFRAGEVLGARPVEIRQFRRAIRNTDAWQVKFRSTDTGGGAVLGIATVIVPRRNFQGAARPLLSYQCAIDALGAKSDPSYTLRRGDQPDWPLMGLALRRGWAVVTSDYNGPQHAYGAYTQAGRIVLDG